MAVSVSFSTVAIIDQDTQLVKWVINGPFIRQHDPDLLPNGNIILFDNWGANDPEVGATRIIELNPRTQEIVWGYAGAPEAPLYSRIRGSQQVLPNGNVLITEATSGRVVEVTRDKTIVWQYVNKIVSEGTVSKVGDVIRAQRFATDELTFLEQ